MEIFCISGKKSSPLKIAAGVICLLLSLLCLLAAFVQWLFFIPCVILGFLFYFLAVAGSVEYEVSWVDGDIRFARIRAKRARKNLKRYTIDSVLQIAPAGDRSVYKYENDKNMKVFDYTSKKPDVPCYDMIIKDGDKLVMYKLELDDKFLNAVCIKNAYKVVRRPKQQG